MKPWKVQMNGGKRPKIYYYQGDQIGQIFAQWVIVYFVQQFKNYRSSAHFWATFSHGTSFVLILTKK
jgi:hypothetical protein